MSRLQNLLGMPQVNTPVQQNAPIQTNQPTQPTYAVDWQNGQVTYGGGNGQTNNIPPYNSANAQGVQQQQNVVQQPTNVQPQTTTIGDLETPEEAYQRVMNEKGGEPSAAQKRQAQSLSELTQYIEELGGKTKPDKDREERENKHARQRALFAAIGDGLSALSNLYFTTKGAPNAYNPNASLSKANLGRWQRMKNQREKDAEKYMNILKTKYGMDSQEVSSEIAAEAAKDKKANNAAGRAANMLELDIKRQAQETARKKNEADAENKKSLLKVAQDKAESDRLYKEQMAGVAKHNAETKDAVAASTMARNYAAAKGQSNKNGRSYHYIYEPRKDPKTGKVIPGSYIVRKYYGTENEANTHSKNYDGAWIEEERDVLNRVVKKGHRFLPKKGEAMYDTNGNRLEWSDSAGGWVKKGSTSKPQQAKPKQSAPQPKATQPSKPTKKREVPGFSDP